jgi:hypothetical protein
MPNRPKWTRRWIVAATWPVGIALTSWDYMWRITPLHRSEESVPVPTGEVAMLKLPDAVSAEDVQSAEAGHGLLFHRRYETSIRDPETSAEELMAAIGKNLNRPAPTTFARFERVLGEGALAVGDEFVVRMPGPWDGPVRVIDVSPRSFRLATLAGHLEAGQIEFRVRDGDSGGLVFQIESLARSSGWLADLLYHHLRMAKEVQAHMWISFLEGVVKLSLGRMVGGVTVVTERVGDRDGR